METNNQNKLDLPIVRKSSLAKISNVFKILGIILLILGMITLIAFFIAVSKRKAEPNEIIGPILEIISGLFIRFAGFIGEAIDDIRNNTNK